MRLDLRPSDVKINLQNAQEELDSAVDSIYNREEGTDADEMISQIQSVISYLETAKQNIIKKKG